MALPVRSLPVLQNWDCHGCTDCCREYRVGVTAEERARIEAQDWNNDPTMKGVKLFAKMGGIFSREERLNQTPTGDCVFLDEKGGCRIHAKFGSEAKPLACRIYPFVLVPAGDHWRIGLRFACPSVAEDRGRPIVKHQSAVKEYVEALEKQVGLAHRSVPLPMLQKAQTVSWSDIGLFQRTFHGIILQEGQPLEWRLRKCLALIELCRGARFDKLAGDRLREFLSVVTEGLNPDVPAHPISIPPPGWIGRILFRQTMAIYSRKDAGKNKGISRHGRLALLWAAFCFARGWGRLPRMHAEMPETTFEQLDAPQGPLPDVSTRQLVRYYQVKIESGQFFGPNNFHLRFWDGLETLILTYPAIMWMSRALNDRPREEAISLGLRMVDDNFGFNPLLGSRRQLFASRLLARRSELTRLVAWYSR